MQKNYPIIFYVLFSIVLSTTNATAQSKVREGFYLSLSLGQGNHHIKGLVESLDPPKPKANIDTKGSGALHKVSGGYGHYFNKIYAGVELSYQSLFNKYEGTIFNPDKTYKSDIEYQSRSEYVVMLGYSVNKNGLLYARSGRGEMDVNIGDLYIASAPEGDGGAFHDLRGNVYGIGYAYMLNEHLSLFGEINRFRVKEQYNNDKGDGEIYDVEILDNQFILGISYQF